MFLLKTKPKNLVEREVYDGVMREYFKYLKSLTIRLDYQEMSELLRHSVCLALDLQSRGTTTKLQVMSSVLSERLKKVMPRGIESKSTEYKQGVLEACVHCIEMTRRRVDGQR